MGKHRIIDLCLDMPMQADEVVRTLTTMCLNPDYRGYKTAYAPGIAAQVGLDIDDLDRILDEQGEGAWKEAVEDAARKNAMTFERFAEYMDENNIEWGITCDSGHDNLKTAEIVHRFPDKFKGFIFVDPNKGMDAVRELEKSVKEYGLHALYLTAFRTHLAANDKKNYPLYAKACELGIPVHIYSSLNLSKAVPYDIGHPRYIDEVARDFPELKIMAGVSGWPWVLDFIALAFRHQNVFLNFETHEPRKMNIRGSGYEPYLYYAETQLKDRLCFASNWTTQSISVMDLVKQVEDLPLQEDTVERILYTNAAEFYK